ncbi:MAG: type II toxin-antitoxin system prevent-host-death family antitoxin [Acidimicrobiales bacterium]
MLHTEIGVRDFRNRTSQVVVAVRADERVVLNVHGHAVADIVPHAQRSRIYKTVDRVTVRHRPPRPAVSLQRMAEDLGRRPSSPTPGGLAGPRGRPASRAGGWGGRPGAKRRPRRARRADLGRTLNEPAGLLDTSVSIARGVVRPLGELPDRVTASVTTIGDLELGLLSAPTSRRGHAGQARWRWPAL